MVRKIFLFITFFSLINLSAQNIGIGTNTPHASAKLDIQASNMGILIPQVDLNTVSFPTPGPATGLLVWNNNSSYGNGVGFYYNFGTAATPSWLKIADTGSVNDADADPNNEIQNLSSSTSGTNRTINISSGSSTTFSVADNDNNSSNEIQTLSIAGSTISLSNGGGNVTVPGDNLGNHNATTRLNMGGNDIIMNSGRFIEVQDGDKNIQIDDTDPSWNGDAYGGVTRFFGDGTLNKSKLEAGGLQLERRLQIKGGNPGVGKVLISDASGNSSWSNDIPNGDAGYIQNQNTANQSANYRISGTGQQSKVIATANNDWFLRGGDDAELRDINVANFFGLYGRQNADRGGLRLGSDGSYIFGDGGKIGIGTTSPNEKLHVNGNLRVESGNINSGGDHLSFMYGVRADDNSFEWEGFYSGTTRQGIILYDGAWNGANNITNEFGITAENGNKLTLNTRGGDVAIMPDGAGKVGVKTLSPSEALDVDGNIHVRNGNKITFSSDASNKNMAIRVSGEHFQIIEDDDGDKVYMEAHDEGVVDFPLGLRTVRHYYFNKWNYNNGGGGTTNLGNYDFCSLAGVAFRNSDSNVDEDDDYQCNVYSTDIHSNFTYNEGLDRTGAKNYGHTSRPYWKLYTECYQDCSNATCTAICINFDY